MQLDKTYCKFTERNFQRFIDKFIGLYRLTTLPKEKDYLMFVAVRTWLERRNIKEYG